MSHFLVLCNIVGAVSCTGFCHGMYTPYMMGGGLYTLKLLNPLITTPKLKYILFYPPQTFESPHFNPSTKMLGRPWWYEPSFTRLCVGGNQMRTHKWIG